MEPDYPQEQTMDINKIYGWQSQSTCTYCHKGKYSTWSFTKQKMKPYTYNLLMERGWRRCGNYYYKTNIAVSCCKCWTLRQDVTKFRIKKDQKKTVKKMISIAYQCVNIIAESNKNIEEKDNGQKNKAKILVQVEEQFKVIMSNTCKKINEGLKQLILQKFKQKQFNFNIFDKLKYFSSDPRAKGDYYCNYIMLLFGINKKIFPKEFTIADFILIIKDKVETLGSCQEYRVEVQKNGYLILTFKELNKKDKSNEFQYIQIQKLKNQKLEEPLVFNSKVKKQSEECQIIKPVYKGQISLTSNQINFGKIRIDIIPAEESVESYNLYKKYCKSIHQKQQKSMSSYVNFLCLQGLHFETVTSKSQSQGYYIPSWDSQEKYQKRKPILPKTKKMMGCFHMKYYLDDKFIAVGVVDIVQTGLSSVYFFYDPAYKENRLGVFSSLIQLEYVKYLNLSFPQFKYYYMGFYIQNCQKMNYKTNYEPCELLCPITYQFVQFTQQIRQLIDQIIAKQIKTVRLAKPNTSLIPDMKFQGDIGVYINTHLKLKYQNQKLTLSQINPKFFVPVLKTLKEYIQVWGKQLFNILTFTF